MLVLSRKVEERIVMSNGVTIMIVDVRGDNVRIGIEAPQDVRIFREEIADAETIRRARFVCGVHRGSRSTD